MTAPLAEKSPAGSIYCPGCNERFARAAADGNCPRCGADVEPETFDELGETLLYKTPGGGTPVSVRGVAADLDETIGRRIGVYECEALLGCGGMGRVYLALHTVLHRRCALKLLSPRIVAGEVDYVQRFFNEGRAAAALVHPNIVTTHAIGDAEGFHFLEMEYVPGRSLQQLLGDEGPLTSVRATQLAAGIARGLAAAHARSILHRDLKPDNVLVTPRGVPKIADFGLAKRVALGEHGPVEWLVGTPNYMAPEVLAGEPATSASDVYSLGVCFFVLLTGRLPFTAGSVSELRHRVAAEPVPLVRRERRDVSLEIAECVDLLLSKSPANRPPDAIAAAHLLEAVAGQARDLESLLREAFGESGEVSWIRSDSRYRLSLTLPAGRRQSVFVEPSDHPGAEKLLLIYSVCCPADPAWYEQALRLNAEILHGSLAVRRIDGHDHFVMADTYPRATVDAEEIRRSVLEVAHRADAVEYLLTGLDRN